MTKQHEEKQKPVDPSLDECANQSLFYKAAYWLAYPFWPKEMRELIKKYKEEGALNENFFSTHKWLILLLNGLLLYGTFLFAGALDWQWRVLVIGVIIILHIYGMKTYLKDIYEHMIHPYMNGELAEIEIIKLWYSRLGHLVKIEYRVLGSEDQKTKTTRLLGTKLKKHDYPSPGDKMKFYVSKEASSGAMPNLDYLIQEYSLKK